MADLRTLRSLAGYLLRFDPVTFLSYLEALRATEGVRSTWLFHSGEPTPPPFNPLRSTRVRPSHPTPSIGCAPASTQHNIGL